MAVLLLAVTVPGHAQESDTADRWRANAQLGFNGASGNTAFSILTAGASLNHLKREFFEFELSGQYRYGTNDDRVIANDTEVTAKFDYQPESDLSPFVFGTVGRDVIRNVEGRAIGGGGAKWTFWRRGTSTTVSLSGAAVAEHENYRLDPGSIADERITVARWSLCFADEQPLARRESLLRPRRSAPSRSRVGRHALRGAPARGVLTVT